MVKSVVSHVHWFSFGTNLVAVREYAPAVKPRAHVVLLHGRFGSARIFEPLVSQFGSEFRFVAPDFPGFGRSVSIAERALSLVEHAELAEALVRYFVPEGELVYVLGHDFGGAVAQMLALRLPRFLSGIVLLNSTLLSRDIRPRAGWRGLRARRTWKNLLDDSFPEPHPHRALIGELWRDRAAWKGFVESLKGLEAGWPGPFERNVWAREIAKLRCPVLLLRGSRDPLMGEDEARELIRGLPEVEYFQESCGHWISLERPEWVGQKIREFLFRLESERLALTPARKSLSR